MDSVDVDRWGCFVVIKRGGSGKAGGCGAKGRQEGGEQASEGGRAGAVGTGNKRGCPPAEGMRTTTGSRGSKRISPRRKRSQCCGTRGGISATSGEETRRKG